MSGIRRTIAVTALVSGGIALVYHTDAAARRKGTSETAAVQQAADSEQAIPSSALRTLKWRNIGPFRGGRVAATAGVISEPNTFYMGTAGGGVFKTTPVGQSWFNVTDGFVKTNSVGAIEVSASDPKVVYVGMGESTGLPASIPGVYLRRAARGRFVTPGNHSIRLTAAGQVLSAPLEVLPDPRFKTSAEEFAAQDRLLVLIEADMASLRQTVLKLISVHDQIVSMVAKLSDPAAIRAGKSLADKLEAAKNAIVQHGVKRREIAPPNLLYDDLNTLHESVNTPGPTLDAAKSDMYQVLHEDWLSHKRTIDTLLGAELEAFNRRLSRSGLPPIVAGDR